MGVLGFPAEFDRCEARATALGEFGPAYYTHPRGLDGGQISCLGLQMPESPRAAWYHAEALCESLDRE